LTLWIMDCDLNIISCYTFQQCNNLRTFQTYTYQTIIQEHLLDQTKPLQILLKKEARFLEQERNSWT